MLETSKRTFVFNLLVATDFAELVKLIKLNFPLLPFY